jgi:hypothetical protein
MRRIGLLAVLVALLMPLATTATVSAPAHPEAVALAQRIVIDPADPATGTVCDRHDRGGPDTVVRVVKKVRGVFVPPGLVPPTFTAADPPSRHEVLPASVPVLRAETAGHLHPRRGPPVTGVHPST